MPKENFFTELKRRNVFKVASIYAVTAWLIIQVVATTFPIFEFPAWLQRWVIILALVGFPVTLILAWVYEVVPDKQVSEDVENTRQKRSTQWLGYVVVLLIGIVGTTLYFNRVKSGHNQELLSASIREFRIAVLPYENKTNDGQLDILGDLTADWIIQGMMNLDELKVVSYQTIKDHVAKLSDEEDSAQSFQELTGAEKFIRGSFYRAGD